MFYKEVEGIDCFMFSNYSKFESLESICQHYNKMGLAGSFVYDNWGKPFFKQNRKLFPASVTNSKNIAIFAVDLNKNFYSFGIDIELKDVSCKIINRICSSDELKMIENQNIQYSDIWMAKESAIKATGVGIGAGLSNVELFSWDKKIASDILKISFLAKNEINGYFFYITAIDKKGAIYED